MGFFSKFIVVFFVFLAGVAAIFMTFFQESSLEVNEIIGDTPFSFSGKVFLSEKDTDFVESSQASGDSFSLERISHLDSIFSDTQDSYSFQKTSSKILLGSGSYVLDFRDITQSHDFSGAGFEGNILGEGRVFIDTGDQDNVSIFSQSATIEVKLLDQSGAIMTEVFLYPHMFFRFQPSKNQFIKKADIVRLNSVYPLSYLVSPLFQEQANTIFSQYFPGNPFFLSVWSYINQLQKNSLKQVTDISQIRIFQFPGSQYIEKYYSLFINEEKKKAYYKNKYLDAVIQILQTGNTPEKFVKFTEIQKMLQAFPEEYSQVRNMLYSLQFSYSYVYGEGILESKKDLFKLSNISGDAKFYNSSLTLSSLYNNFDISGVYSYAFLEAFFNLYLSELGIDIKNKDTFTSTQKLYLDYFLFFLEKIFLGGFDTKTLRNEAQETGLLRIFSQYSELSPIIYNLGDDKKKVTALYIYVDILSNFEKYLLRVFFEPERTQNNTLARKTGMSLSADNLARIKTSMDRIFSFYLQNKVFLDDSNKRDIFIERNLDSLQRNIIEYFSALENYTSYLIDYDKIKKDLLSLETGVSDILVFDKNYLRQYFSQFQGLSLENAIITISETSPIYGEIKNITINGSQMSLRMSPLNGKLLDSIVIDGKPINSAYKLDNIELDLEEKLKNAPEEERIKYDFSYFFINTFFTDTSIKADIFETVTAGEQEDSVVVVFKRDKLLGTKGEFASILSLLPISYKSISVVENNEVYDISLSHIPLQLSATILDSSVKYDFDFSSQYRLTSDTHEFYNIELKTYRDFQQSPSEFEFGGTPIALKQPVSLKNFQSEMNKFIFHYTDFKKFYSSFSNGVSLENTKIECILKGGIYTVSGSLSGKSVLIRFSNNRITNIIVNGKEKLNSPIASDSISEIQLLLVTK